MIDRRRKPQTPPAPKRSPQTDGIIRLDRSRKLSRAKLAEVQVLLMDAASRVLGLQRWERAHHDGLPPVLRANARALGRLLLADGAVCNTHPYQWRSGARPMSRAVLQTLLEFLVTAAEGLYGEWESLRSSIGLEARPLPKPLLPSSARWSRPVPLGLQKQKELLARAGAFIPTWCSWEGDVPKLRPYQVALSVLGPDNPQVRGRGYEWLSIGVRADNRYRSVDRLSLLTMCFQILRACDRILDSLYKLRSNSEVSDTTSHVGERGTVLCGLVFHAKVSIAPVPNLATCDGCLEKLSRLPASRIALVNGAPVRRSATWATRLATEQPHDSTL